jgi:hypothetical protein
VPIPGTSKLARLQENLRAAAAELTSGDLADIDRAAYEVTIVGDRYPRGTRAEDKSMTVRCHRTGQAAVCLPQVLDTAGRGTAAHLRSPDEAAAAAALEDFTAAWGERYPTIVKVWRAHWTEFTPFLGFSLTSASYIRRT